MSKAIVKPHQFNRPVRAFLKEIKEACKEMLENNDITSCFIESHFILNGKDILEGQNGNPPKVIIYREDNTDFDRGTYGHLVICFQLGEHVFNIHREADTGESIVFRSISTSDSYNTLHFSNIDSDLPLLTLESEGLPRRFFPYNSTHMSETSYMNVKVLDAHVKDEDPFTPIDAKTALDDYEINDLYINLHTVGCLSNPNETVMIPFRDFLFLVANQRLSLTRYPEGNEVTYMTEEEYEKHVKMEDFISKMSTNATRLQHIQNLRDDNLTRMSEDNIFSSPNGGRQHFGRSNWGEKGFSESVQFSVDYKNHSTDDTYLMSVEMSTDIPCISVFPKPVMKMLGDMGGFDMSTFSLKPYQVIELGEKSDYILSRTIKTMPVDSNVFYPFDLGTEDQYITMKTTLGDMKGLRDPVDGNRQRFVLCRLITENGNVFKGIEIAIQSPLFQAHLEVFSIDMSFPEIVEKLKSNPSNQ